MKDTCIKSLAFGGFFWFVLVECFCLFGFGVPLLLHVLCCRKITSSFQVLSHDATATGLESSASYEMHDTLSVCLSLRDFHLFFPCRLLCAWLVVYSEETCPLHMRT